MNRSLRIAVADDEPEVLELLRQMLSRLGHEVVATARSGRELVERCREQRPDLVLADVRMPEMDGIEAARAVCEVSPVPVILVSGYHDDELIRRAEAEAECVFAYLVKPVSETSLGPAIALAVRRFEQTQALRQEAAELRQALEDRKLIERAKGILTRRMSVDEPEAFRRLRKLSSDRNWKLIEIARKVVKAEEIFESLEKCVEHGKGHRPPP